MSSVHLNGAITTDIENRIRLIAAGGDAFTREAINRFLAVVSTPGVSTGQIIAAAAELKQALGASKAYYDVIGTLGDDLKRLIGDAVK
ncbi:MAG TPA: hypothetical protein VFV43_00480 [Limnobacter sp.]|nr:hypothetical protein [Limnobacter sp.]